MDLYKIRGEIQNLLMFSLPTTVEIAGQSYPVRTDYRAILEILVMLDDPDLSDGDKTEALLRMFCTTRS